MSNQKTPANSTPQNVIIWGAGGHAKVVADIVRRCHGFAVLGFIDEVDVTRKDVSYYGSSILGGREYFTSTTGISNTVVALGVGDNAARMRTIEFLKSVGIHIISAVDPSAVISQTAQIAPGCVIMPGAVINADAQLDEGVIVNTAASVDHDCRLSAGVHIAPGVHLAGTCHVGAESFLGVGSCVRNNISIGSHCTIGAGSVVVSNIPDSSLAYGNPARVVQKA